ncbi:MAG: SDR family oxidoreductase [Pseudomonadota bacterium]
MRVLITGTEGYIGTRLAASLRTGGVDVVGLDTGFYCDGTLYSDSAGQPRSPAAELQDLRSLRESELRGIDAVVHLAELSNDPLGEYRPSVTYEINHQGSVRLAKAARAAGVKRFVYASSCSVYGVSDEELVDERSAINPQTAYADCKRLVERDLAALSDASFAVVFLRNATAYGPSPRMRFDIVINDLCGMAWTRKHIQLLSDGTPWRPVVHVEDICAAFRCALDAPEELVNGEVFNVGHSSENYRISELANLVASVFPDCDLSIGEPSGDNRSYRVSFDKILHQLPGYKPRWTAERGVRELRELFDRIQLTREQYEFRAFTRLKQLRYLRDTGRIDQNLYWQSR